MIAATQPIKGMFPFQTMKSAVEAEPGRTFVVDVGGGRGTALISIMEECGGTYDSKMVLQDMHHVLEGADPVRVNGIENMPANFFDPQPVKSKSRKSVLGEACNYTDYDSVDAHIYYLRFVLHNHYDAVSRKILGHVVDAMGPTSRVLIGEMILPTSVAAGQDPFPFFMDINMFMEGGVERTEQQFEKLLAEVGLKIDKIWRLADNPVQCTIEASLM